MQSCLKDKTSCRSVSASSMSSIYYENQDVLLNFDHNLNTVLFCNEFCGFVIIQLRLEKYRRVVLLLR